VGGLWIVAGSSFVLNKIAANYSARFPRLLDRTRWSHIFRANLTATGFLWRTFWKLPENAVCLVEPRHVGTLLHTALRGVSVARIRSVIAITRPRARGVAGPVQRHGGRFAVPAEWHSWMHHTSDTLPVRGDNEEIMGEGLFAQSERNRRSVSSRR